MADIEYLTVEHLSTKDLIRIFSKVSINPAISWNGTPCWVWTGTPSKSYSHVWWNPTMKHEIVHRIVYAWLIAPLPRRIKGCRTPNLDHLCRNRRCVNALHLELVTPQVNSLRGNTLAASNAAKTHCKKGHLFSRVRVVNDEPERYCGECARSLNQRQRLANPERYRQYVRNYRARNIDTVRARDREQQRLRREKQRAIKELSTHSEN